MFLEVKKLLSVSATSKPVTETREEMVETDEAIEIAKIDKDGKKSESEYLNLLWVLYIRYSIIFRKRFVSVSALFDSGNEFNVIYSTLAKELGLPIKPTDIGAQKIDGTMLNTFGMIVTAFLMTNKANRVRYFKETFLVANISLEVVLEMSFLSLSDTDVDFSGWKLRWRTYTTKEALLTIRHIELVGKKEFAAAALDSESETFIVHIASLSSNALPNSFPLKLNIHLSCKSQVSGLIAEKALTKVSTEYLDFADVFSPDLASEFLEYIGINDHVIELVNGHQPPYEPIYSLGAVELCFHIDGFLHGLFPRIQVPASGIQLGLDRKF